MSMTMPAHTEIPGPASRRAAPRRSGQPRARVQVETVTSLEGLAGIETCWNDLAAHALEGNVLHSPAMALAAWRYLNHGRGISWLLVWRTGGPADGARQLIGLFPLTSARRRWGLPVRAVSAWHHLYGFLTTPLVHRDHAGCAIAAMLGQLSQGDAPARFLTMRYIGEQGAFYGALMRELAQYGMAWRPYWRHERAMLDSTLDGAGYLRAAMSAKRAKEYRRKRARLEELGALRFEMITGDGLERAVQGFIDLEARGWKGKRGSSFARDTAGLGFLRRAARDLGPDGGMRVGQLVLDGTPIASTMLLVQGRDAWLWKIAYDEDFARFSPGVLLVMEMTVALLADPAIGRVDSCAIPDHPMIDKVWRERLAMTDLVIALRPGLVPASVIFTLEAMRRSGRALGKGLVNAARGMLKR